MQSMVQYREILSKCFVSIWSQLTYLGTYSPLSSNPNSESRYDFVSCIYSVSGRQSVCKSYCDCETLLLDSDELNNVTGALGEFYLLLLLSWWCTLEFLWGKAGGVVTAFLFVTDSRSLPKFFIPVIPCSSLAKTEGYWWPLSFIAFAAAVEDVSYILCLLFCCDFPVDISNFFLFLFDSE